MVTGRVTGHIWHQNGARAHMGTGRVPGHILAPEGFPGTYEH